MNAALNEMKFQEVFVTAKDIDGIGNFYTGGRLIEIELNTKNNVRSISLDRGVDVITIAWTKICSVELMAA